MSTRTDVQERVLYLLDRQDEAYHYSPTGSWFQRWIPGACHHERVRCTHGDEALHRRARCVCMVCGRSLDRPLPVDCFFTGQPH